MLIKQILDSDIANCYDTLEKDERLNAADDRILFLIIECIG